MEIDYVFYGVIIIQTPVIFLIQRRTDWTREYTPGTFESNSSFGPKLTTPNSFRLPSIDGQIRGPPLSPTEAVKWNKSHSFQKYQILCPNFQHSYRLCPHLSIQHTTFVPLFHFDTLACIRRVEQWELRRLVKHSEIHSLNIYIGPSQKQSTFCALTQNHKHLATEWL